MVLLENTLPSHLRTINLPILNEMLNLVTEVILSVRFHVTSYEYVAILHLRSILCFH